MTRRPVAIACLALAALAGAAGCGRARQGKHLVGFSQCNLGEPWRVAMNAEVAARAKDFPDIELAYADQGTSVLLGAPFSIHGIVDKIDPVLESMICIGQNPPPPPGPRTS